MYYMNLINKLYKEKIEYELEWLEKYNKAYEDEHKNEKNEKCDNFNIIVFLIVFLFIIAIITK